MGIREQGKGALGVLQSTRVVSSSCFINHELLFCFVFFFKQAQSFESHSQDKGTG